MDPSTLLLLVGVLACPIGMGVMMWLMNKNMSDQHTMPGQPTSANAAERLAALRAQRQALEAEIAEAAKIVELEAKRRALLAETKADESAGQVSEAQGATR